MKWNWQQKNWPHFSYNSALLEKYEELFIRQSGIIIGAQKHLSSDESTILTVELISDEALNTSSIEGEYLNRDSLQSSIRRNFGLDAESKKISIGEKAISDMMIDVYESFEKTLSHQTLFSWHEMLMFGRRDLEKIGEYRTHKEPMQIVSGIAHKPIIYFEAPPSSIMTQEMENFIEWFNQTAPNCSRPLPALIRAGIAHLYFESIHPFEDGNGRIGRAIVVKALSQALGASSLIALSNIIQKKKKKYYEMLEQSNKTLEITEWIDYFANVILEAQNYSLKFIEFLINKTKLYDKAKSALNRRQQKTLARMFAEGLEGFKGGLSTEKYITITKTSRATATRDLQDLLEKRVLIRTGQLKGARYFLNLEQRV